MKALIDIDVLVHRVGYGCKDYDLFDTLNCMDDAIRDIKQELSDWEPVLVLSQGGKTFRHDIAVTAPYKGNRKAEKPKFYNELREYLVNECGATLSGEGFEADDYIGMNCDRKTDVISTIDKDLNMIPAWGHYNFVKKEMTKIKRPAYFFWHQMLTGDKSDNIIGLTGIGEKRATALLDGYKTSQMRKVVEEEYKREFAGELNDEQWFKRFDENARLLWIKRHADKEYYHYL